MGPLLFTAKNLEVVAQIDDEDGFVALSDCRIHYSVSGNGEPVILLHGWGANLFCWRMLTPLMVHDYRVYEIDLPGFGRSSKGTHLRYGLDDQCRRLIEFMDRLKIKRAKLVGSSMGGAIALWMGKNYPERVENIVTIAPAAHRRVLPTSLHHFSNLGHMIPKFMAHRVARFSLDKVITKKELITEESLQGYLSPFLTEPAGPATLLKAAEALRDHRLPDELSFVQPPVMVIYGDRDNVIKRRHIDDMLSHLPSSAVFKTHNTAGHHVQEDEPEWVFAEIQDFFQSQK